MGTVCKQVQPKKEEDSQKHKKERKDIKLLNRMSQESNSNKMATTNNDESMYQTAGVSERVVSTDLAVILVEADRALSNLTQIC